MIKIAHLADVHVRNIERHEEYQFIFQKLYDKLSMLKPDRIVIAGDLFQNYIEIKYLENITIFNVNIKI